MFLKDFISPFSFNRDAYLLPFHILHNIKPKHFRYFQTFYSVKHHNKFQIFSMKTHRNTQYFIDAHGLKFLKIANHVIHQSTNDVLFGKYKYLAVDDNGMLPK